MHRRVIITTIVILAVVAASAVGVTASAQWQRMRGIDEACTRVFENDKTNFEGYHWNWLPPAWVCEFGGDVGPVERRLPFGQR